MVHSPSVEDSLAAAIGRSPLWGRLRLSDLAKARKTTLALQLLRALQSLAEFLGTLETETKTGETR